MFSYFLQALETFEFYSIIESKTEKNIFHIGVGGHTHVDIVDLTGEYGRPSKLQAVRPSLGSFPSHQAQPGEQTQQS